MQVHERWALKHLKVAPLDFQSIKSKALHMVA